jgi:transcriptional regulator with XRE-family HTH domain
METAIDRPAVLRDRAFGLLLGALRRRAECSQGELADAWGVSVPTLKRTEAGRSQPTLDVLRRLAAALGASAGQVVELTEALSTELLAGYGGSLNESRRRAGNPLEIFVEQWLGSMHWTLLPAPGLLASWPSLSRPGRAPGAARSDLQTPAFTYKFEEGGVLTARDSAHVSRPLTSYETGVLPHRLEGEVAAALLAGFQGGRPRVGARIPPALESGRIAAGLAGAAAEANPDGRLPMLYVATRRAGREAYLREVYERFPASSAASVANDGLRARVDFACCDAETAAVVLGASAPIGGWRTVVIDGLPDAELLGLVGSGGVQWPGGVVAVLDNTLIEPASKLRDLLGGEPEAVLDVCEAMHAGLLPALAYRGLPDPVSHREIGRHMHWPHPGKKGAALSRDERLEVLLEAGAFGSGANTVVHVADSAQQEWAVGWLSTRLGREVRADGPQRLDRIDGKARGRTWVFQRVARLAEQDEVDELVLLSPEFPRRMLGQIVEGLRHADVERGLRVWDLLANDLGPRKRLESLTGWLGAGADVSRQLRAGDEEEEVGPRPAVSALWAFPDGEEGSLLPEPLRRIEG